MLFMAISLDIASISYMHSPRLLWFFHLTILGGKSSKVRQFRPVVEILMDIDRTVNLVKRGNLVVPMGKIDKVKQWQGWNFSC